MAHDTDSTIPPDRFPRAIQTSIIFVLRNQITQSSQQKKRPPLLVLHPILYTVFGDVFQ